MGVEDIEVQLGGGLKLKGVYVAVVLGCASSIAGTIWTASEFFSRLEAQEQAVGNATEQARVLDARFTELKESQNKSLQNMQVSISTMQTQLQDNDIGGLSAKLSELGTNLTSIMESQRTLLPLSDRVAAVEKSNSETVLTINSKIESIDRTTAKVDRQTREIEDLWAALDSLFGR
jgi:hypothetical protein